MRSHADRAARMPSRRTATGAVRRTRAVSCMRSLDQTRQQRPKPLLWCKGRPRARRPQRPAANAGDRSDSGFFALEGDPHQRCLAMTVHPAEREGWVIDDQRTTTGREPRTRDCLRRRHPAMIVAAGSRSEVPRHLRATAAATQRAPPAAANLNTTPRPTPCNARIARTELPLRNQTFPKPERSSVLSNRSSTAARQSMSPRQTLQ